MMKYFLIFSIIFIFLGCASREPTLQEVQEKKQEVLSITKAKDIKAFEKAKITQKSYAKWFQKEHRLPLKIYIQKPQTQYEEQLVSIIKQLSLKSSILGDLKDKVSDVEVIVYEYGSTSSQKVEAAYAFRLDDKERLNDVLAEDIPKGFYALSISLDADMLEEGVVRLHGFKTVTYPSKHQNSIYYYFDKKADTTDMQQILKDGVFAILNTEILNYISIKRNDIADNKALKIISQTPNGYLAQVYKMKIYHAIDTLKQKQAKEIQQNPKNAVAIKAKYKKLIDTIQASSQWVEYQSKQLLYCDPISQNMIDTLYKAHYIQKPYDANNLSSKEAKEIAQVYNFSLPDQYLTLAFPLYKKYHNQFGINIGAIKQIGDSYFIKSEAQTNKDNSAKVSTMAKNSAISLANGVVLGITMMARLPVEEAITYEDVDYKFVTPNRQKGVLYPVSAFAYKDIGIERIYTKKLSSFEHSSFTIPINVSFYIDAEKKHLGIIDDKANLIIVYDLRSAKKLSKIPIEQSFLADNGRKYISKLDDIRAQMNLYRSLLEYEENPQAKIAIENKVKSLQDDIKKYNDGSIEEEMKKNIAKIKQILQQKQNPYIQKHYQKELLKEEEELKMYQKYKHKTVYFYANKEPSYGYNCAWKLTKTVQPIPLFCNDIKIQYYRCASSVDIFDKKGSFITRLDVHKGLVWDVREAQKVGMFVSFGKYSAKVWSLQAYEFLAQKF